MSIWWERSGSVVECLTRDREAAGFSLTGVTALCPWARHMNPSLVLVQPRKARKARPYITEILLLWRKESNQTNKQKWASDHDLLDWCLARLVIVLHTIVWTWTLNVPIATKVVCFFRRLLKCLSSLYGKQCRPRSDCSYRSSLFWIHAVCFYTLFVNNIRQSFAADDFSRRHF